MLGCTQTPTVSIIATPVTEDLSWIEGCWTSVDRTVEERWVRSQEGSQLFGYSTTTADGSLVFFEQIRIDLVEGQWSLHAYPRGIGPTRFEGQVAGSQQIIFLNIDNEFPQKIQYQRSGEQLVAEISLADETMRTNWTYRRCDS